MTTTTTSSPAPTRPLPRPSARQQAGYLRRILRDPQPVLDELRDDSDRCVAWASDRRGWRSSATRLRSVSCSRYRPTRSGGSRVQRHRLRRGRRLDDRVRRYRPPPPPVLGPVGLQPQTPQRVDTGIALTVETLGQLLGLRTIVANWVPASAFPSGERVEAVAGDDVEAVLALNDVAHPRVSTTSDEAVVADLVGATASQARGLPLLQFTLAELYDRRVDGRIDADALSSLGGMAGAIGRRADAVYDALDLPGQQATRELFARLVAPRPRRRRDASPGDPLGAARSSAPGRRDLRRRAPARNGSRSLDARADVRGRPRGPAQPMGARSWMA
jgi:hypothetical protein